MNRFVHGRGGIHTRRHDAQHEVGDDLSHSVDGGCGPEEPRRGAPIGWRLEARPDREQRHGGSLRELGHEAVVADVVGADDGDNRRVREREHGIQRGWLVKNGLFPQMQLDAR